MSWSRGRIEFDDPTFRAAKKDRQGRPIRVIGDPDEFTIPLWVRVRVATLGRHFVGQIVINVYEGGVTNFQVKPRGGDSVTFQL